MLRRLAGDNAGAVLIEFALILPLLVLMYLGTYLLSDMIACNRKVAIGAATLTNLVSRSLSPTIVLGAPATTSAATYLSGGALVLSPYPLANATETITLLRVCSTTQAYKVWSQTQTQDNAGNVLTSTITAGSPAAPTIVTLPSGLLSNAAGYYPLAPTSTSSATTNVNICANTPASGQTPVVGQAGAYFYIGTVNYNYTPVVSYNSKVATPMSNSVTMSPRLN